MYNQKIDVWGVGCITYQLLSGLSPFNAKTEALIKKGICSNKPITFKDQNWNQVSDNAKDFIKICLERNQHARPTIPDLLDHPWISESPENSGEEEKFLDI